jgi:hypothetical protein
MQFWIVASHKGLSDRRDEVGIHRRSREGYGYVPWLGSDLLSRPSELASGAGIGVVWA